MDTGCAQDLVSADEASRFKQEKLSAKRWKAFETANGTTYAKNVAVTRCHEFDQDLRPYILENSPAVLSIGKRCMKDGFSFV